jgi:hypothetical protein
LEEIDIGDGKTPRPTFVNKTLETDPRNEMIGLLKEYSDCFAWNYTEMLGLSREIIEHRLHIKSGFISFKQRARTFRLVLLPRIKDEIHRLLEANFIGPCRYAEWVSNIVPVEKKESAEDKVIGAGLTQETEGKEHVVTYLSQRLVDAETRYTFIEKLCLCLFYACTKCKCYLLSSHCTVSGQADVIKYMLHNPIMSGRIGKWALAAFDFRRSSKT